MAVARSMAQREFVLSCDKDLPPEEQTKFFVIPLAGKEDAEISDLASQVNKDVFIEQEYEGRKVRTPIAAGYFEKRMRMVMKCLVGCSNYKDEAGNEIDFSKLTPEERYSSLYPEWREELAEFIESLNYPTEAAVKN